MEIPNHYFEIDSKLDETSFNVGSTFEDYLNNKFVILNDDQIKFRDDNPNASIEEIYNMKLNELVNDEIISKESDMILLSNFYYNAKSTPCEIATDNSLLFTTIGEVNNINKTVLSKKSLGQLDKCAWYLGNTKLFMSPEEMEILISNIYIYFNDCDVAYQDILNNIRENQTYVFNEDECKLLFPERINLDIKQYGA